ncbi:trimethylamine methyltransferase family protein [Thermodesulfobacteriota bacterium]
MLSLSILERARIERIIDEASEILAATGVGLSEPEVVEILAAEGAEVVREAGGTRVRIPSDLVKRAVSTAPAGITLYDRDGAAAMTLAGDEVHFVPGSAALHLHDADRGAMAPADTDDTIRFVKVVDGLEHLAAQSTAVIPSDVPFERADAYRLAMALIYSKKPVVTGTFSHAGLDFMERMLTTVRGGGEALRGKPLAIFDCCPVAPLRWREECLKDIVRCARAGIPVEFVSMPQPGLSAPMSLHAALVQHTAETLSGVVIAQLASRGAPVIYGGSPTSVDLRTCAPLLGAAETFLMAAYAQVGKHLGLPTHVYLGLSDAKMLDMQSGFEMGAGAIFGALLGVNVIAGPGMLANESAQSIEGVVIANDLCGTALRVKRGIGAQADGKTVDDIGAMIAAGGQPDPVETMKVVREGAEYFDPGPVIDRETLGGWTRKGEKNIVDRARDRIEWIMAGSEASEIDVGRRSGILEVVREFAPGAPLISRWSGAASA